MKRIICRIVTVFCILAVVLALTPFANVISAQNPSNYAPSFNAPHQPTLICPHDGATGISANPLLSVTVTDPDNDKMSVTFWGREVRESFTIVALPDTHIGSTATLPYPGGIFALEALECQTQWIVHNRDTMNTVFVTHLGDIVDRFDDVAAWASANATMSILDGEVPYAFAPGNHDFDFENLDDPASKTNYNTYFPYTRYEDEEWYGGSYPEDTNNNSFQLFTAGGMDFIILHLEISADDVVLEWADNILEEYSSRRAIVVSHSLLDKHNSWTTRHSQHGGNGKETYEALKANANLFLMLCGHIRDGDEQMRTDTYNGNTIYTLRSVWWPQEGWLRILEFSPDTDEILIKTYSPWLDEYNHDEYNEFVLSYTMSEPFEKIGTVKNVKSGDTASITWPGRAEGKEYEWYVTVSDGDSTAEGPRWSFSTSEIGIENLITTIQGYNLPHGIENSLIAKLQNARDSLAVANAEKREDAVNKLQAFIKACEAQRNKALTSEQADSLIAEANAISAKLQAL